MNGRQKARRRSKRTEYVSNAAFSARKRKFRPQALFYHINDVKSIFSGVIDLKKILFFFMNTHKQKAGFKQNAGMQTMTATARNSL